MLLYHYSSEARPELLTLRRSDPPSKARFDKATRDNEKMNGVGFYFDHISFFFDPIPRNIGSLYKGIDHKVWKPGMVIYEHVVDTKLLMFSFEVVESPIQVKHMNDNWKDDFLLDENEDDYYQYWRNRNEILRSEGLLVDKIAYNDKKLVLASAPFVGVLEDYYKKTLKSTDKETLSTHYAPSVPHVMLYPKDGVVPLIEQSNPIKLT